ncbi:MAG: AIR synthase related protein, partial [Thermoleophilaceae bacterium]
VLDSEDPQDVLPALLSSSNLCSRRVLFEQYDCLVQSRTVRRPEQSDAAVLQLQPERGGEGPRPGIAVSIDGNGRRVACDPYQGTVEAVLECAANLACAGAEPLGLTNCLNFGNPERPHVAWQLERSVAGMAAVLTRIGVPVVGGNVSLYNESGGGPIYPTPVVGMVGRIPDVRRVPSLGFAVEGHRIALLSPPGFRPSLPGSELAKLHGEPLPDGLPEIDVEAVAACIEAARGAARAGALASVHDVAEGGLVTALAECCLAGGVGASVELPVGEDPLTAMFGEGVGRFVVSGPADAIAELGEPAHAIGTVGGEALDLGGGLRWSLSELGSAADSLAAAFA